MSERDSIIKDLKSLGNDSNVAGMARFGINTVNTLGISMPVLRQMAKAHRKKHGLAHELWQSGIHEARILACLIDDPRRVTQSQMDRWTTDFDSWDICDQVCSNLWEKTSFAYDKALEWSCRDEEFVKRAGFVLMARLAVGKKDIPEHKLAELLPEIIRGSTDGRNFVKKAVNWALRQIGKKSTYLHSLAINTAGEISALSHPVARWIAADALRELKNPMVIERLHRTKTREITHAFRP